MRPRAPRTALLPVIACLVPAVLAAPGCGNSPPPEVPQVTSRAPEKPKLRAPLDLPGRLIWISRDPAKLLGTLGQKKLYSVGGERWLVGADGQAERERASFGDSLDSVFPYPQGGLVIGWNSQHAYTFGDVLGAPKLAIETTSPFTHVRPGPNAVLLFTLFSGTAIDLSTGLEKGGFFPAFPLRDAIFVDGQRGVVATALGGVATTTDAGKTWKPISHVARVYPTLDLLPSGSEVYLKEIYTNRVTRVDIDKAEVGDFGPALPSESRAAEPIERWITTYGNPIHSAVKNGIDGGNRTGIVAWGDTVARVDLGTGLFVETARLAGAGGECRGTMAGKDAYLVCGKKGKGEQLWRVKTTGKLTVEEVKGATFGGPGSADVIGSGAGGLVVLQGCGDKWGDYCARQPDGGLAQVDASLVPYRDIVPLADGRVVSVGVRAGATGPLLEVVAATERERKVLEEASFQDGTAVSVTRPEQDESGVIRFLVKERPAGNESSYLYVYAYEPGKKGFRKTALPDLGQVSLGDGVLVAVAKDLSKTLVSHDFGVTFQDVDMPKGASSAFTHVNRLGLVSRSYTRVGWAPLTGEAQRERPEPQVRIQPKAPVTKELMELSCTTSGAGKTGAPIPRYDADLRGAFGVKPAPKGTWRSQSSFAVSALDPSLLLLIEGKEPRPGTSLAVAVEAEKWVVHFLDPTEISPKVRTLSTKAPYKSTTAAVRGIWAQEGKLFFTVDTSSKSVVVRSKGNGLETAEVHLSMYPSAGSPVSFSSDGSVIAYLAGELLVVWKSGEAPRPIAAVSQRAGVMLGAPAKEGVPVFADIEGQSFYRVFPIPAGKAPTLPHEERVSASWDGWTRSVTLLGGRGPVALCGPKPAGSTFHTTALGPNLWTQVWVDDDAITSTSTVRFDAVTDGQALCVKSLTVHAPGGMKIDVKGGGGGKAPQYADLLRIGASGKKGEITRSGKVEKPQVYAMTCAAPSPRTEEKKAR